MGIYSYLKDRGLVEEESSSTLDEFLQTPRNVYLGIDPTAVSLHLGNLLGLIVLKMFQDFGHRPVIVIGGTTAMIGDPSGKSVERPLLTEEVVQDNILRIEKSIRSCLDFQNKDTMPIIVNNSSWYNGMNVVHFLRDVGKQFRLGPMLGKESVRTRVNSQEGMSFTEFSYQLLQAHDFYHLFSTHNVELQIGGSDQYGNITAGIEYTRKRLGKSVYGFVFPLLTRSDGKKFGKSEEGAIWLDKECLSPFQFYQHIVKFPDADMISLLKKCTFIPLEEIAELDKQYREGQLEPFHLQRILAESLTLYVHGNQGLLEAKAATEAMAIGSDQINAQALKASLSSLPTITLEKKEVIGVLYLDLLCKSGLLPSKGEARKLVQNNGAYLNRVRVEDTTLTIQESDLLEGNLLLLSSGKKKSLVVQIN